MSARRGCVARVYNYGLHESACTCECRSGGHSLSLYFSGGLGRVGSGGLGWEWPHPGIKVQVLYTFSRHILSGCLSYPRPDNEEAPGVCLHHCGGDGTRALKKYLTIRETYSEEATNRVRDPADPAGGLRPRLGRHLPERRRAAGSRWGRRPHRERRRLRPSRG